MTTFATRRSGAVAACLAMSVVLLVMTGGRTLAQAEHPYPPPISGCCWAGYDISPYPPPGQVGYVSAQWVVPTVTCPASSQDEAVAIWIAIDPVGTGGYKTEEEPGVEARCELGVPQWRAFDEMFPASSAPWKNPPFGSDPISSGDLIEASVSAPGGIGNPFTECFDSSLNEYLCGPWKLVVKDLTKKWEWTNFLTDAQVSAQVGFDFKPNQSTAGFTVEAPEEAGAGRVLLPPFTPITFKEARIGFTFGCTGSVLCAVEAGVIPDPFGYGPQPEWLLQDALDPNEVANSSNPAMIAKPTRWFSLWELDNGICPPGSPFNTCEELDNFTVTYSQIASPPGGHNRPIYKKELKIYRKELQRLILERRDFERALKVRRKREAKALKKYEHSGATTYTLSGAAANGCCNDPQTNTRNVGVIATLSRGRASGSLETSGKAFGPSQRFHGEVTCMRIEKKESRVVVGAFGTVSEGERTLPGKYDQILTVKLGIFERYEEGPGGKKLFLTDTFRILGGDGQGVPSARPPSCSRASFAHQLLPGLGGEMQLRKT